MAKDETQRARKKPEDIEVPVKPLKPSQCRNYMRKRLAKEIDGIMDGFVEQAKAGSCAHVKLTSELLDKAPPRRASPEKGPAELVLEKWKQE